MLKNFMKLAKHHFGPILGTFDSKTQNKIFYKKKSGSVTFKLDETVTLCKKLEHSMDQFWRNRQMNKQTGKHIVNVLKSPFLLLLPATPMSHPCSLTIHNEITLPPMPEVVS